MSGSELWLVAEPFATTSPDDAAWLARWLGVAIGMRVRLAGRGVASGGMRLELPHATAAALALACERLRRGRPAEGAAPRVAVLDAAVAELERQIDTTWPDLQRPPRVPVPYRCAIVLTHDVDAVDRWTGEHVAHLARHVSERLPQEGARALLRLPWAAVRRLWDHPAIDERVRSCVALERRFGGRGSYLFFAPDARYRTAHDGWYTARTRFCGRPLAEFWQELQRDGFDVGLHLSIGAHADAAAVRAEWQAMRTWAPGITSCRSHYLKEAPGLTRDALARAGAGVDLNLVATGYRYGTGAPFRPTEAPLYRLPTVLEDEELPADRADPVARQRVWEQWEEVLTEARRHGSVATVLLHPGKVDAPEMLERLLQWGTDHNAWMTSASELITYWRKRETRLVEDHDEAGKRAAATR